MTLIVGNLLWILFIELSEEALSITIISRLSYSIFAIDFKHPIRISPPFQFRTSTLTFTSADVGDDILQEN
mgnify:CR=1 FL=1